MRHADWLKPSDPWPELGGGVSVLLTGRLTMGGTEFPKQDVQELPVREEGKQKGRWPLPSRSVRPPASESQVTGKLRPGSARELAGERRGGGHPRQSEQHV